MSQKAKQLYSFTDHQMGKLVGQGTYPGAAAAWDRARQIREAGGNPEVFYSEFNGFTVLDGSDTNPETIRRLLSFEQRSKPFPG
jgi:hypothetical protein